MPCARDDKVSHRRYSRGHFCEQFACIAGRGASVRYRRYGCSAAGAMVSVPQLARLTALRDGMGLCPSPPPRLWIIAFPSARPWSVQLPCILLSGWVLPQGSCCTALPPTRTKIFGNPAKPPFFFFCQPRSRLILLLSCSPPSDRELHHRIFQTKLTTAPLLKVVFLISGTRTKAN